MSKPRAVLHHEDLEGAITSDDALGKDVIDSEGKFIGVSSALYLDPKSLQLLGMSVDKGFLRKGLVIGASYIREVTAHAVFLSVRPAYQIKGMTVYDSEGAKVGTVKEVSLEERRNKVRALLVRRSRKEDLVIPAESIQSIEDSVFLSVRMQDFS